MPGPAIFREGTIDGVVVRPLMRFEDSRGWLIELYREDELQPADYPCMAYVSQTLPGLGLIELYYKHALEIVSILEADEDLRSEAGAVLTGLLPGFQSAVDGNTMTLTAAQLDKIKAVIGGISAQAGSELGEVLAQMVIELNGGQLLQNIGVSGPAE